MRIINHFLKPIHGSLYFIALVGISLFYACGGDEPAIDCAMVDLTITAASSPESCPDSDGSITVTLVNGSGEISYSLDNQNFQANTSFTSLTSGEYTVYARTSDNCTTSTNVVVGSVTDISFTSTNTAAGCGGNAGTLTINASGGNGIFEYAVDGGNYQSSNVFNTIENGNHEISVRDSNGCESGEIAYVKSGISFTDEISSIITTYCAVSGCHAAGEDQPDFTVFANVQSRAMEIKERTQSGNMPRGTTLPDEFIDALACWVDDGALDN